jgi:O-antigen/teichoic acid export membrane protein
VHAKPDDQVLDSGQSLSADFWSFTRPRAVATLAQAALKRLDIVLVAALRSPEEAAIYTAATRFLIVGQLGVQAVQQAMSPQLGGLFASGKHAAAQELYRTATAWTMSFAWPVYLVSAFLAGLVLSLFDEGYGAGRSVIVILALAMLVATACGAVDALLLMSGRSWLSLANILIALGVNVVANVLLLPDYGIRGAAIAWALAIITRNMLGLLQVRYFLEIGFGAAGPAWWVAVSAGSSYGLVGVGLLALDVSEWVSLAVFIGLSTPLYAVMLWLRREDLHLSLLKSTVAARAGGRRRETVGSSR